MAKLPEKKVFTQLGEEVTKVFPPTTPESDEHPNYDLLRELRAWFYKNFPDPDQATLLSLVRIAALDAGYSWSQIENEVRRQFDLIERRQQIDHLLTRRIPHALAKAIQEITDQFSDQELAKAGFFNRKEFTKYVYLLVSPGDIVGQDIQTILEGGTPNHNNQI